MPGEPGISYKCGAVGGHRPPLQGNVDFGKKAAALPRHEVMIVMRNNIKLLVAVVLIGGGALIARAEETRIVDTNEHEWTMNHSAAT